MWEKWHDGKTNPAVEWSKAHAEAKVIGGEMPIRNFIINALADVTCDAAAEAMVDEERARRIASRAEVAKAIAKRLGILELKEGMLCPK